MSIANPTGTTSNPMNASSSSSSFNLQIKRTLPREVLKWMQGLDLSYAVKDYRKDLSNGFIIGEIVSRYEPTKIPSYALEDSTNVARRQNNWNIISLFFSKYTLRDIKISADEYDKIKNGTDHKAQQLYQFICRLYSVCTKKTLPDNAPVADLPPTQTKNPNFTTSYLLKQDGLEKLDRSSIVSVTSQDDQKGKKTNNMQGGNSGSNNSQGPMSPLGFGGSNRPIMSNFGDQNLVGGVQPGVHDVIAAGVKIETKKPTGKKKSWNFEVNLDEPEEDDNIETQKMVYDYLNAMLIETSADAEPQLRDLFPMPDSQENADNQKKGADYTHARQSSNDNSIKAPLNSSSGQFNGIKPTEVFRKFCHDFSSSFVCTFLNVVIEAQDNLIPCILRQINEIWKFFSYFLKLVRPLSDDDDKFSHLVRLLKEYGRGASVKQPQKITKVLTDSLLEQLVREVQQSSQWKRRRPIMGLVYNFIGPDSSDKKAVLFKIKDLLKSDSPMFMEWLSVLVDGQSNPSLLEDFIYYSHQHLHSPNQALRTPALMILQKISSSQAWSLVEPYFMRNCVTYQVSKTEPEQTYLLVSIYFRILKETIASKEYQTVVKGHHTTNLVKVYNPDNEKNAEQLRKRVGLIAQTIFKMANNCNDPSVKEITAQYALPFIIQHQYLMLVLLDYYKSTQDKQYIFSLTPSVYEFKNLIVECGQTDSSLLIESSNEILATIIGVSSGAIQIEGWSQKVRKSRVDVTQQTSKVVNGDKNHQALISFLPLINYTIRNINIKKVNMEIWQDIANNIAQPYCQLLGLIGSPTSPSIESTKSTGNLDNATMNTVELGKCLQEGIIHLWEIYFNYDMRIKQLSKWMVDGLVLTSDESKNIRTSISQLVQPQRDDTTQNILQEKLKFLERVRTQLTTNYQKTQNQHVRNVMKQVSDALNVANGANSQIVKDEAKKWIID